MLTGACQFGHGVGGFTSNFIHSAPVVAGPPLRRSGPGTSDGALRCVAPPLVPGYDYEELSEAMLAALLDRCVAETEIAEKAVDIAMEVVVGELGSSRALLWRGSSYSLSSG